MLGFEIVSKVIRRIWDSLSKLVEIPDQRMKPIALLYLGVFFLHGVLDPAISYVGIEILGRGWEGNPVMRIPMQHGIGTFLFAHIPLYIGLLVAYSATVKLIQKESNQGKNSVYYLALVFLSLIAVWGILLNVWNIISLMNYS